MKLIAKLIIFSLFLVLTSCHAIIGYEPGYKRVSFKKWTTETFTKIGIELQLPEEYRLDYSTDKSLRISLHTYYPKSMLAEYTPTYYISVRKFASKDYSYPTYREEYVTSPFFFKDIKYINIQELNGRLDTDNVHLLIKHQRDSADNIFVIKISIYPWPDNHLNIQEDIEYGYKIIDSLKILEP